MERIVATSAQFLVHRDQVLDVTDLGRNDDPVAPETDLLGHLQAIAAQGAGTDERIFVRGDKAANYGVIMQVMGRISGAGYKKVALITDQDNNN